MKRLIALAACVLTLAACQDRPDPVAAAPEARASSLLGLNPVVSIDPTLRTLLKLTAPAEQLEVFVTFDESVTSTQNVASALTASGAGIIKFRNLPIVFALATPAQITSITTQPGVTSVYSNKQLRYFLAESTAPSAPRRRGPRATPARAWASPSWTRGSTACTTPAWRTPPRPCTT